MVEAYCGCSDEGFSAKERVEILEDEAFLFYIRKLTQELEFIVNQPFAHFWAEITKDDQVMDFLDALLLNMRKRNDVFKLQVGVLEQMGSRQASSLSVIEDGGVLTTPKQVKQHMNKLLACVLKIFYRISKPVENDKDYFALPFYQELVYNNWFFDIAKIYDIVAVYGKSNPVLVKSIVESVFENDKRYVQDFKDGVDTIISMLKKSFSASLKVSDMMMNAGVI